MAEHLPCIPEPAGWVRHLQREHAEVAYPVPHCRKDRQNWPCDTIKALEMAAAAERERLLNGPVARIEPDPDQPGYNRGVFDVDAAIAQAVAAERERCTRLVHGHLVQVCATRGAASAAAAAVRAIHADLLRGGDG